MAGKVKLKPGVSLRDVSWRMFAAALLAEGYYRARGAECVITSAADGKHKATSKHYARNNRSRLVEAIDIRISNVKDPERICRDLQRALGEDYDVVLEVNHLHLEWDPV